jgi:UDP-N-acetylglucosamine 2-epimerase
VNIGIRQRGRVRAQNVIDVGDSREEIAEGVQRATSDEFRRGLNGMQNPYGDGHAAERIVSRLKKVELDSRLLLKRFHDIGGGNG